MSKKTPKNLTAPNKPNGANIEYYENGTKWHEEMWMAGKLHGMTMKWWKNGNKKWEAMWRDDKLHGVAMQWSQNNTKWQERTWVGDQEHGVRTDWHDNSQKRQEIYFVCGKECARVEWSIEGNVTEVYFSPLRITPAAAAPQNHQITNSHQ